MYSQQAKCALVASFASAIMMSSSGVHARDVSLEQVGECAGFFQVAVELNRMQNDFTNQKMDLHMRSVYIKAIRMIVQELGKPQSQADQLIDQGNRKWTKVINRPETREEAKKTRAGYDSYRNGCISLVKENAALTSVAKLVAAQNR
jgi:hypothetical protein